MASIAPPLRCWALRAAHLVSPTLGIILGFLVLAAFTVTWLGAIQELPRDQWWSQVLSWGGFAFFLFLIYRLYRSFRAVVQA